MGPGYQLQSDKLQIGVFAKGAELHSIRNNAGFEYLWQADPKIWARHAPVLFPVVGRLKENRYVHEGREYYLSQHGFARDMKFNCLLQRGNELLLELCSTEHHKLNYPFDFRLRIHYHLNNDTLFIEYEVENSGADRMYFSLGAHPGFNLSPPDSWFIPSLGFDLDQLTVTGLKEGLLGSSKQVLVLDQKKLNLYPELFAEDALVLEENQIKKLSLFLSPEGRGLEMNCEDWPFFGIWSKPDESKLKYVCLEPWYGVADESETEGLFHQKKGILHLEPGARFQCALRLRFF